MTKTLTALATAFLAFGGQHCYRYLKEKKKRKLDEKKVEVWEGEGGAVPVAPNRTAAQITPRTSASASPRSNS
jgi:hypothetical protein